MTSSVSRLRTDWAVLAAQHYRLGEPTFREEAKEFARDVARRARENVERIIDVLAAAGYVFVHPDSVHRPPQDGKSHWFRELEEKGVHVPLILEAWMIEVGSVNLMGSLPSWPLSGYHGIEAEGEGIWYTDPLVVELDAADVRAEFEEWELSVSEEGREAVGPFQVSIAPDHIHKANVSGGLPYSVDTSRPALDALLFNCRDYSSVFHHVANAFSWGGFPGFAYEATEPPRLIAEIRRKLVPF